MESIGEKKCVIGHLAPEFTTEAFHENDVKKISLKDYRGKWVVSWVSQRNIVKK